MHALVAAVLLGMARFDALDGEKDRAVLTVLTVLMEGSSPAGRVHDLCARPVCTAPRRAPAHTGCRLLFHQLAGNGTARRVLFSSV